MYTILFLIKETTPLSKGFFVQCKLYRNIWLILLEKQVVGSLIPMNSFGCTSISPVTFRNDHGNHIYVSQCTPLSLFLLFCLFTTSVSCVYISKVV